MIFEMLNDITTWWLFGTAVIFTMVGRWLSFKSLVGTVTEATIDSLIEQGYLKTQGTGKNMEILKWTEWCEKEVDT